MIPFYQGARFLTAATRLDQCPTDSGREVAFAGRSNAGKSSAINAICYQKALARTSKTPGRTQQLIFFELGPDRRLVDLPGYGYAKVSIAVRDQWQRELSRYLESRRSLAGLVIVMDIRHPLTEYDRQMLQWGQCSNLSILLLLTKADKLKQGAARAVQLSVERAVVSEGSRTEVALFSATERRGVERAHRTLDRWLERAEPPAPERSSEAGEQEGLSGQPFTPDR